MAKKSTIDICRDHLFDSEEKMEIAMLSPEEQHRIVRMRECYQWWINHPEKSEYEVVQHIMEAHSLHTTHAREQLQVLKVLIGDLNQTTKNYARWQTTQWIDKAAQMAITRGDAKTLLACANAKAKWYKIDELDPADMPYDDIVVQPFKATDDPSVLGITRQADARARRSKLLKKYGGEDIQAVKAEVEDIDFELVDGVEQELPDDIDALKETLEQEPNEEEEVRYEQGRLF